LTEADGEGDGDGDRMDGNDGGEGDEIVIVPVSDTVSELGLGVGLDEEFEKILLRPFSREVKKPAGPLGPGALLGADAGAPYAGRFSKYCIKELFSNKFTIGIPKTYLKKKMIKKHA
jgi:hypothetical protein